MHEGTVDTPLDTPPWLTLSEAEAMWQARAELLADRLAAAESRILALSAPQSP